MVDRDDLEAVLARALSTGVSSLSSMATSPATAALSFVPVNAAHVLRPMRALIAAPISTTVRSFRGSVNL
jgi:hypothetical protein